MPILSGGRLVGGMRYLIGFFGLLWAVSGACAGAAESPGRGFLQVRMIGGERAESSDALEVFCRTAVEIMGSRFIGERALKRVETLEEGSGARLKEALEQRKVRVQAEWVRGTTLIRIQGAGSDVGLVDRYSGSVMVEYLKFLAEQRAADADKHMERLTGQILRLEKQVETAEAKMADTRAAVEAGGGKKGFEKAKANYSKSLALYHELADGLRQIDLEKNLQRSADVVEIVQLPGGGR